MLKSMQRQNDFIDRIYRGEDLVWEMHGIMVDGMSFLKGMRTSIFKIYPGKCKVKVVLNKTIIVETSSSLSGNFTCTFPEPLKTGDIIAITITKDGWREFYYGTAI